MDAIFGYKQFRNEIILEAWRNVPAGAQAVALDSRHDPVLRRTDASTDGTRCCRKPSPEYMKTLPASQTREETSRPSPLLRPGIRDDERG